MKLNINPNLFEQILRQSLNESDDKMQMVKQVFELLTSPDPQNVELAKQYLEQEYFKQEYMPLLNKFAKNKLGVLLSLLPKANWMDLLNKDWLGLRENGLTQFPEGVCYMPKLKELWLQDNQIAFIPECIGNLINLEILSLADNDISEIPNNIGNLVNLEDLYLQGNNLQNVPQSLGNLKNLKFLALGGNPIPKSEIELIKKMLPNCSVNF